MYINVYASHIYDGSENATTGYIENSPSGASLFFYFNTMAKSYLRYVCVCLEVYIYICDMSEMNVSCGNALDNQDLKEAGFLATRSELSKNRRDIIRRLLFESCCLILLLSPQDPIVRYLEYCSCS